MKHNGLLFSRLIVPAALSVCLAPAPVAAQMVFLPLGDSITAGAAGGPSGPGLGRGGYRYYIERFLEGSQGGVSGFAFTGSVTTAPGTLAAWAGQWFSNPLPLKYPLHSGYSGYSISQITALVLNDTVPVGSSNVVLLQIGTNNIGTGPAEPLPATPAEIASWTADYRALLDALLAKNPAVQVAMAKIPPMTSGVGMGNIAANAARIEPFNAQVVVPLHQEYASAHPGRFFLVDNYSPLDPLNVEPTFDTATNDTDFLLREGGDGVHPYNAGHRKMAVGFWKASQLALGKAAADLITVHDGGEDACIRETGTVPDGGRVVAWDDVARQPFVRSGGSPGERAKYYVKLDLSGKPKDWQAARFNLVFWGGPSASPDFGNCVNNAPSQAVLKLYGLPDGSDGWTEQGIQWANAPRNDTGGPGVVGGVWLGDLVVPAGAKSGDVISVASPALTDFVNHQRGLDGKVTMVVTGDGTDAGYFATFQDSDFRDYLSAFLQVTRDQAVAAAPGLRVLNHSFDFSAQPRPRASLTFVSEAGRRYLLSGSTDLRAFDAVLAAGIIGQSGQTQIEAELPDGAMDRFFLRIEAQ